MSTVNITIDGRKLKVPANVNIWGAARTAGIKIPTLCHYMGLHPAGACRVCMVEVEGARTLVPSCTYPVSEGMVVRTHTPQVISARRMVVELMLANHPQECLTCDRNLTCELQDVAASLGIKKVRFHGEVSHWPKDETSPSIVRDPNKCILCGRCVRTCSDNQTVNVYSFANRGFKSTVTPAFFKGLGEVKCTLCGQCVSACPTSAITIKNDIDRVRAAIADPSKHVVVQTAPAVRVALGELFGQEPGTIVTGKMVAALRLLGFDRVWDTNFSADLTIMEEGHELIHRMTNKGVMPMITSCSPGWINFLEMFYPELMGHHSSAKSPQQMFGTMAKTYYPEKSGIPAKDIVSVSIMPCTAKKAEALRPEMRSSGYQDVDLVLTTRELGQMIKEAGLDLTHLEEEKYDPYMGVGTGAATIFGVTGGVMEAALRTAKEILDKKPLDKVEFQECRGLDGIKEAEVELGGQKIKIAISHGLGNARKVCDALMAGNPNGWQFIEVMACPGGCVSGGGQPISTDVRFRSKRIAGLYTDDEQHTLRKSHENPEIKAIYNDFLGEPLGPKAHDLLHTHFHKEDRPVCDD